MPSRSAKRARLNLPISLPTPVTTPREPSEEFGDMDVGPPQKNPKTGRPIRSNAGRRSLNPSYLDTTEAVDAISDEELDEDAWQDEEIMVARPKFTKPKLNLKRKRSEPSPPPPVLSPGRPDFSDMSGLEFDPEEQKKVAGHNAPTSKIPPINLTVHIPPGFKGPLQIQLDPSMFQMQQQGMSHVQNGFIPYSKSTKNSKGFLDIPAEIRNQIYRHLMVKPNIVDFANPHDFPRTAALLRTCRQVYEEARSILYSENKFLFEREQRSVRQTYSLREDEVGYKHSYRILTTIGPHNIAKIRFLGFEFEDMMPRHAGHALTRELMRYVYDNYLIESLKLIGQHGQLYKLTLMFFGRYVLRKNDARFLRHLYEIKADTLLVEGHHPYWAWRSNDDNILDKVSPQLRNEIKRNIVRESKMFPELAAQEAAGKAKAEEAKKKKKEEEANRKD